MAANDPAANYNFNNYCVCFIDLLGQRKALEGEGLIPDIKSEEDRQKFVAKARESIGAIAGLQRRAEQMILTDAATTRSSTFRAKLSPKHQRIWDDMQQVTFTGQRWSDGLVYFVNLGDTSTKCLTNGVYNLIALAGCLCLLGLTRRQPIRGAIDAAWAIELHPGEIYGAAVARAYELESEVAQWPRIVIGPRAVGYLLAHREIPKGDVFTEYNKSLAELCLRMLKPDIDGNGIVNYLGEEFQRSITQGLRDGLYRDALAFVQEEVERHHKSGDEKLYSRYYTLLRYLQSHAPLKAL